MEEADIIELEKKYWVLQAQSKSGRFDLDTFIPLISPPMPPDLCEGKTKWPNKTKFDAIF